MENQNKFWIPEPEFKELCHNIWKEINENNKIKQTKTHQTEFHDKNSPNGFVNVVAVGEETILLG